MEEKLEQLKRSIQASLETVHNQEELEAVRIQYLGRKGQINRLFKEMLENKILSLLANCLVSAGIKLILRNSMLVKSRTMSLI